MRDEVGRRSRALVLRVNLASLLAFAVLVPPAMIGIAQRAAEIGRPGSEAAIVALTGTAGSVCGIGGALLLGRLSDARSARVGTRWGTAALGAFVGLSGIVLMTLASAPWMLVAGWSIAEMGCSGALAVLRAMLSEALPAQRRRGATAMVILSYLGASVPLLVLLLLPDAIWSTSLVLALCAVAPRSRPGAARRERRADRGTSRSSPTLRGPLRVSGKHSPPRRSMLRRRIRPVSIMTKPRDRRSCDACPGRCCSGCTSRRISPCRATSPITRSRSPSANRARGAIRPCG